MVAHVVMLLDIVGHEEPTCSRALGMESGDIKDEQITASSFSIGHEPFRARLNLDYNGELYLFLSMYFQENIL